MGGDVFGLKTETGILDASPSKVAISADLPDALCGFSYLIAQVDYRDLISECDESNNVASVSLNIICPDDIFSLSLLSYSLEPPVFLPDADVLYTMSLKVQCWLNDCMGEATHPINNFPSHYSLELAVSITLFYITCDV